MVGNILEDIFAPVNIVFNIFFFLKEFAKEKFVSPEGEGSWGWGGRVWRKRRQESDWTYAFQLPAAAWSNALLWEGRLCRLQCGLERFMPHTLNA